jgi:hypothetical protein
MEMAAIQIRADYDEEADVWVAQSDEIPLVTEAATFEILLPEAAIPDPGRAG